MKFAGVVFPGETIRVRGWREDGRIVAAATVAGGERDGAPVLGDVRAHRVLIRARANG